METNLERLAWCSSWMRLDTSRDVRQAELTRYRELLEDGQFTSRDLFEFSQLLEYEIFAVLLEIENTAPGTDQTRLPPGASREASLGIVETLSARILNVITVNHLSDCELQFRCLLSSLLLLHAHGAHFIEATQLQNLEDNLRRRLGELRLNRTVDSTSQSFRRAQCSFLLHAAIEVARRFRPDEPRLFTGIGRFLHFASFALNVASPAVGGNMVNLRPALHDLAEALRPPRTNPQAEFRGAFEAYQNTLLANVLHNVNTVREANQVGGDLDGDEVVRIEIEEAKILIRALTERALQSIAIDLRVSMDAEHSPPAPWIEVANSLGRNSPSFSRYHAVFLLIDASIPLKRIVPACPAAAQLEEYLIKVTRTERELTVRCKALEYVLTSASYPARQIERVLGGSNSNNVEAVIPVISEYLYGQNSFHWSRRPSTTSLPGTAPSRVRLSPLDWNETVFAAAADAVEDGLDVEEHSAIRKKKYRLSGISPNGRYVFFLKSRSLVIHALHGVRIEPEAHKSEIHRGPGYDSAVMTNDYIASICGGSLILSGLHYHGQSQLTHSRPCWPNDCAYTAVAMQKVRNITYLAASSGNARKGRIEVFEVKVGTITARPTLSVLGGHFETDTRFTLTQVISLSFNSDGTHLACVRDNSTVLVWRLLRGRPHGPPFSFQRQFELATDRCGITSVTPFNFPGSGRPYVLSTTSPSASRAANPENLGEWSYIDPVAPMPSKVPKTMIHSIDQLRDAGKIMAGAVSSKGNLAALAEQNGRVWICRLGPNPVVMQHGRWNGGGVCCIECRALVVPEARRSADTMALRVVQRWDSNWSDQVDVIAVDNRGRVVRATLNVTTDEREAQDTDDGQVDLSGEEGINA